MVERRQVQRTRVLKAAKIILNTRASVIDCTVRNLTNLGACVEMPSVTGTLDSFDLTFDAGRSFRNCHVIWRAGSKFGIVFR
jgi:ribosomal protein S1